MPPRKSYLIRLEVEGSHVTDLEVRNAVTRAFMRNVRVTSCEVVEEDGEPTTDS